MGTLGQLEREIKQQEFKSDRIISTEVQLREEVRAVQAPEREARRYFGPADSDQRDGRGYH